MPPKSRYLYTRLHGFTLHKKTLHNPVAALLSVNKLQIKMDKRAKDKLVKSPTENGGGQDAQKDLHSRTGRNGKKGKTQERMERGSRKRSSSAGSEKMERVGGR